jgi:pimeloyl-ACP methyl ester carboxylesterase
VCAVVPLFHRDLGGAGKPPLVILHGILGSSRNWLTAGRDLSTGFHVHAIDLRNHGRSPHASAMSYAEMAEDVAGWIAARNFPRVTVLGHSMGGKVGMLLACRRPACVERLVVVDIAPKGYHWRGHRASFAAMNELNLADLRSRAEAEMRLESRVPDWGQRKFLATNLERADDGKWFWQINLPALTAALPQLEANSLGEADRFDGPTRFILGGNSNYVAEEDRATIMRHFPAAEIRVLARAGHNPHMEVREEFVAEVLRG